MGYLSFLSSNASVQTLVDEISKYGFYKDNTREEWIGIPLWVHRRCKYPMFDIANKISYGGNMVQAERKMENLNGLIFVVVQLINMLKNKENF